MLSFNSDKEINLSNVWEYLDKIPNTPYTLRGHSRASERSGFFVPELNILFDAGIPCFFNPKLILVTHCHSDHSCSLPMIIDNFDNPNKLKIVVPSNQLNLFNNFINSSFQLFKESKRFQINGLDLMGMMPDNIYNYSDKIDIHTYNSVHSVKTLSYGVVEKRKKLKNEFKNCEKDEIIDLKKKGVFITETKVIKQFVYVGDTSIKILESYPELFEYNTIIIECTYLYDDDYHHLENKKHIHWNQLRDYVKEHPDTFFILIHFSLRYKNKDVEDFFEEQFKEHNISNCKPWLN